MCCSGHYVLDELVATLTDALNTTAQVTRSYRDEVERGLLRLAAARATGCLGRPGCAFDKPGRIHLLVTDWGNNLPHARFDGACSAVSWTDNVLERPAIEAYDAGRNELQARSR